MRARITDKDGGATDYAAQVAVRNVAPAVNPFPGATILLGETYTSAGTFTDPGTDTWSATVDHGDGAGAQPLALDGREFALAHEYVTSGRLTTTVTVGDDDGGVGSNTATVVVLTPQQALAVLAADVDALAAAGRLSTGDASALSATLAPAVRHLERGQATPATNQIEAFVHKAEALVRSGRLMRAEAVPLTAYAGRIVRSIARR